MRVWIFFAMMAWIISFTGTIHAGRKGNMIREFALPSEVMGWNWDKKDMKYDSKTVFSYMDGAAELYLAYAFENLTVRRFEKEKQPPITLEFYEMASSEDAYGVFSYERQDETAGIGQGSEFGGGLLRFWKGKYFVSVYAEGEGPDVESGILQIGKATASLISSEGREPKLTSFIPGKELGLTEKSVRYIRSHILLNQKFFISHQNILNLSPKTQSVLAQYSRDNQKAQLLLIQYLDSRKAADAYQSFTTAYLPDAHGKDRLRTEDGKWTFTRQQDEFIIVVFGAATQKQGEALIKATEKRLDRK